MTTLRLASLEADGGLRLHFHPGQLRAWLSTRRFVTMLAGTQGGKTCFGPYWLLREIFRRGPGDYLVVTPTFQLLEKKALPEFLHLFQTWLGLGRYARPSRLFTFSEQGSVRTFAATAHPFDPALDPPTRIIFGYADDPESLESATVQAAWLDEAGQKRFKLGAWEAILRRLSIHQGRVLITTTPYAQGWLKAKLFDRWQAGEKDIDVITFDSSLNPGFPLAEFQRAERDLPRYKFERMYRAKFENPPGLIYDAFNLDTGTVPRFPIPRDWKRYLGIDFGPQNMAACFYAEEPGTKRLYLYRTYHAGGQSIDAHVRALLHGEPGLPRAVGGAPSEKEWRNAFAHAGLSVRAPRAADVELGITRVYTLHQKGELLVFDDLEEYLEEKTSYSRVLDSEGKPTEAIDHKSSYHLLDAERYILSDLRGEHPKITRKYIDLYGHRVPPGYIHDAQGHTRYASSRHLRVNQSKIQPPFRTPEEIERMLDEAEQAGLCLEQGP